MAIQNIGQPSPASVQISAQRNQRLLALKGESEATKRQESTNRSNQLVAAMQAGSRMGAAGLGEQGATQRAHLGADVALKGQETQQQISEERNAALSANTAAMIDANMERDKFQAAEQTTRDEIRQGIEAANRREDLAIAKQDKVEIEAARKEEMDLRTVKMLMDSTQKRAGLVVGMRYLDKMAGTEEGAARKRKVMHETRTNYKAQAESVKRIQTDVNGFLEDYEPLKDLATRPPSKFEIEDRGTLAAQAVADLTSHQQIPITIDLLTNPENRDKLEQQAAGWGQEKWNPLREGLDGILAQLVVEKEKTEAGKGPRVKKPTGQLMGFGGPVQFHRYGIDPEANVDRIDRNIKEMEDAIKGLDRLLDSTRTVPDSPYTVGQTLTSFEQNRRGQSEGAIVYLDGLTYGEDDTDGFSLRMMDAYLKGLSEDDPTLAVKPGWVSPEARAMYDHMRRRLYGSISGLLEPESPGLDIVNMMQRGEEYEPPR